jgi:hypothetical protein
VAAARWGRHPRGRLHWQERYDRSIEETDEAIRRAEAERSPAEKILERSTISGTLLDLVLLPFVALGHGIAALVRRRRGPFAAD